MKIGGVVWGEKVSRPSELVKVFHENGIETVELLYNHKYTPKEVDKIKNFNMDFSLHCPLNLRFKNKWGNLVTSVPSFYFCKEDVKLVEKSFEVAEELNVTHYVMHGGVFPKGFFHFKKLNNRDVCLKAFVKAFEKFFIETRDSKVKIVLENLTHYNFFSECSDIRIIQEKFPWLGFCLDFAHSELYNQTYLLKNARIDHVHVSDHNIKNDSHLPVGKGKLDFVKLFKILKDQDFNGKVIAECEDVYDTIKSVRILKERFLE